MAFIMNRKFKRTFEKNRKDLTNLEKHYAVLHHSHKKWKDSLETRAILIEISMLHWNLPSSPTHQGSLQKNMAFPEGNKLFPGDLCANLDEKNADLVQFTKRWNWKWIV